MGRDRKRSEALRLKRRGFSLSRVLFGVEQAGQIPAQNYYYNDKALMNEKLIKTLKLKNRMRLDIFDCSRKLAGDRWLIKLIARMAIPISETISHNSSHPKETINEIMRTLGENVLFEQKRERIFVDEAEKEIVFVELYDSFISSTLDYLSNDAFPEKYILKKFREKVEKTSWYH